MEEDLAFVDPERREEVRRRIAAVKRFLASPGRAHATRLAQEIGLGPGQFYRLVNAWKATGRADGLAQAVRRHRVPTRAFDEREMRTIRRLEAANPDAPVERVVAAFQTLVDEGTVRRRGLSTIRKAVKTARGDRLAGSAAGTGLLVDHCAIDLPVVSASGARTMPVAALVLDLGRRTPIGIALDAEGPSPTTAARALLHALGTPGATDPDVDAVAITLDVDVDAAPGWAGLVQAFEEADVRVHAREVNVLRTHPTTTTILGEALLGVPLRPRNTARPPHLRRPRESDGRRIAGAAVTPELAEAVLQARLTATRGSGSALDAVGTVTSRRLEERLRGIADRALKPSG